MFLWPFAHELWKDQDHRVLLPSKLPRRLPGKKRNYYKYFQLYIISGKNLAKAYVSAVTSNSQCPLQFLQKSDYFNKKLNLVS